MKKKLFVIGLVILTIALGFIRDHIFVSINKVIESSEEVRTVSKLKWVLTILFSCLYLLDACVFLYTLFQSKKYVWIAIVVYAFIFTVSFVASFCGYFFSSFDNTYTFARTVMGIAQSPVVMMVLIAACYLEIKLSNT